MPGSPPVGLVDVRPKSWKSRMSSLSRIPGPWFRTVTVQWLAAHSVSTVIVEPGGENLTALSSRLASTCRTFSPSSASASGRGPGRQTTEEPLSAAVGLVSLTEAQTSVVTDGGREGEGQFARLEHGHVEQIVDRFEEGFRRVVDGVQHVALLERDVADGAVAQEVGQGANRHRRIAKIMGRHAKEPVLRPVVFVSRCDAAAVQQVDADARQDRRFAEGLGEVGDAARRQSFHHFGGIALGRDEDERGTVIAGPAFQRAQNLNTFGSGKPTAKRVRSGSNCGQSSKATAPELTSAIWERAGARRLVKPVTFDGAAATARIRRPFRTKPVLFAPRGRARLKRGALVGTAQGQPLRGAATIFPLIQFSPKCRLPVWCVVLTRIRPQRN